MGQVKGNEDFYFQQAAIHIILDIYDVCELRYTHPLLSAIIIPHATSLHAFQF